MACLHLKPRWPGLQRLRRDISFIQVCGARLLFRERPCILYSLGSNGDSTFEEGMLQRASCDVHTFDPFIAPEVKDSMRGRKGINYHDYGIAEVTSNDTESGVQMKDMQDIMSELRHEWVDILKCDIEGSEWGTLLSIYKNGGSGIYATQLLLEVHYPAAASEQTIWEVLDYLTLDNFRLFSVEPNVYCGVHGHGDCSLNYLEFSFIKVSPDGHICSPRSVNDAHRLDLPSGCLR